jgi:hypothetical protein
MTQLRRRSRLALAGLAAAAAIGSAAPAQADPGANPGDCDVRLERLEAQFRAMEERHGWEEAAEWWQARWHAYYQSCVAP